MQMHKYSPTLALIASQFQSNTENTDMVYYMCPKIQAQSPQVESYGGSPIRHQEQRGVSEVSKHRWTKLWHFLQQCWLILHQNCCRYRTFALKQGKNLATPAAECGARLKSSLIDYLQVRSLSSYLIKLYSSRGFVYLLENQHAAEIT